MEAHAQLVNARPRVEVLVPQTHEPDVKYAMRWGTVLHRWRASYCEDGDPVPEDGHDLQ